MTCACTETSSADTGSSQTIRPGSSASARAMTMRWRCPPENSWGVAVGGVGTQADARQQLGHALADGGPVMAEVAQGFADDVAHAHAGVHGRKRILEDELHASAHGAQLAAVHLGQVLAFEEDASFGGIGKADQAFSGGGFSAAGLAHQAQRLAAGNGQGNAIDRAQHFGAAPAVHGEVLFQADHFQHGHGGGAGGGRRAGGGG